MILKYQQNPGVLARAQILGFKAKLGTGCVKHDHLAPISEP
jgi:hypothetical protein